MVRIDSSMLPPVIRRTDAPEAAARTRTEAAREQDRTERTDEDTERRTRETERTARLRRSAATPRETPELGSRVDVQA